MKLFTTVIVVALAYSSLAAPALDSSLVKTLQTQKTVDVLISFKNANVRNVRTAAKVQAQSLGGSRAAVTQSMYNALKAHADSTQRSTLDLIRQHQSSTIKVFPFWITNQIGIKRMDNNLLTQLMTLEDISEIREAEVGGLIEPVSSEELPQDYVNAGEQWGIVNIDAISVWEEGAKGENITVGSLDTGVMATHVALRDAYRNDHGWYDPAEGDLTPTDFNSHGTHTIGTMIGRANGIGVAPLAKFISCKGMNRQGSGSIIDYVACGQFFVCPHLSTGPQDDPRCDLSPVAVGNSWGKIGNFGFFDDVIDTWIDAGIAPVFAAGNEGLACSSLRSPGNAPKSITIGATTSSDQITSFSSPGPNPDGLIKPTVSAPGEGTISASTSSDTAYSSKSGTSMATPHVVGLIALLHSKRPNLTVAEVEKLLTLGAQPTVPLNRQCGGVPDSGYPNNHVGYGRISARASVDAINKL
ncbi:unnamed protein product [Allacma fusca]|uniref:Peptidase S8/S53 domain-containing protein n=1 Tax=Allacma fusca TaxID=39272 RepID=A0A8J2JRC3_9HEXA|nr:unnamed protein product [Allacma fusca]